ncbi:MAG: YraN family protein [bacterium]|nr:YraN family protein [bacterium]
MPNNIKIGQIGEDLACQYLLNNKYKIIDRNYRETWGEIDIICKNENGVLVFVEVKALKKSSFLNPEENLHSTKLKKVKRTAYLYANNHPELISDNKGWQIDLLAVEIDHSNPENIDSKELLKYCQVRHYENI